MLISTIKKELSRKLNGYNAHFELKNESILLELKSLEEPIIFEAIITRKSMPSKFQNVISSPQELFQIL